MSKNNKSSKRKSYNWAVVSTDGKVLREAPSGRRALYMTRDAARTALKSKMLCKGGSVPKTPQKAIEARVMKRSWAKEKLLQTKDATERAKWVSENVVDATTTYQGMSPENKNYLKSFDSANNVY